MAKSPTQKIFETNNLAKISSWTKSQLNDLRAKSPVPIITKLANGDYRVATFEVSKNNGRWLVGDTEFYDKRSAILFCALMHVKMVTSASALTDCDAVVKGLDFDKELFKHRLSKAHLDHDEFNISLFGSRLQSVKYMFKTAKKNLEFEISRQFRALDINNVNTLLKD